MLTLDQIRKLIIASALALTYSFAAQATVGQPGTLDPFWATGSPLGPGKVVTPVGNGSDAAAAVIVQPDGKVLLGGTCTGASYFDFCVVRYDSLGVLDPTFGNGGKVITAVGNLDDFATAMALQPDGKFLLVGHCQTTATYHAFCAVRYNGNGTLDTANFGSGTGKVITPVGPEPPAGNMTDIANTVVLQPDGKILVAGGCTNGATLFCVVRYNNNGTLDATFGGSDPGKVFTAPVGGVTNIATTMSLQIDGKVLVAGYCFGPAIYGFCAVRYNVAGTLDQSFNGTGKVFVTVGADSAYVRVIALQPDGRMVLAGDCRGASNTQDFCVVRYNSDGSLDGSFGPSSTVITPVGSLTDFAHAMALQPDGKLLVAGECDTGLFLNFCLVRYHGNGALDTSFGGTGKVITAVGNGNANGRALALQPDGKIVLAGYCESASSGDFCAVRYDGGPFGYQNCKLDIDGDGRVLATTDMLIGTRIALGITGNAVIGGITFSTNATRNTWPLIRDYLVTQCGLSLVQ